MRVICIDKTPRPTSTDREALQALEIGAEYTVVNNPHPRGYELLEVKTKCRSGFFMDRFIPLSEIDETTFERNFKKELV